MNGSLVARAAILVLGALEAFVAPGSGEPEATLYFFVTPEAEGGPEGAKTAMHFAAAHAPRVSLRPVLLAQDFKVLRIINEECPLYRTLKALEKDGKPGGLNIPLFDEEGLSLAMAWEIKRVPAFVLVRNGHAHAMAGANAELERLWECSR